MEPPALDRKDKDQRNQANHPEDTVVIPPRQPDGSREDPYLERRRVLEPGAEVKAKGKKVRAAADAAAGVTVPAVPTPAELRTQRRATQLKMHKAVALRIQGESVPDIAELLGVSSATVTGYFTTHRRAVSVADIHQQLDAIALPLATENLMHGLLAGDKDYTLKTLEGRGAFRRHSQEEATISHTLPPLVIRFEGGPSTQDLGHAMQPGDSTITGKVVGAMQVPKQIGAAVLPDRLDLGALKAEAMGVPAVLGVPAGTGPATP